MRIRWGLFAVAGLCSLAQIWITPPFQHPDEPAHYARILQISRGEWVATKTAQGTGGWFPSSWVGFLGFLSRVPFHGDVRVSAGEVAKEWAESPVISAEIPNDRFYSFNHMALYSPAPYLPQLLGVGLARLSDLNLLQGLYLVRFANWLASMLILFFSLRLIRNHGRAWWAVFLVFSTPMALAIYASPSADALLLSLSGLVAALWVAGSIHLWLALGLTALFSASKLIFFLIPLCLAGVIWNGGRRKRDVFLLACAALLPNMIWIFVTKGLYSPFRPGVSAMEQLAHSLAHPLDLISVIVSTTIDKWKYWVSGAVGILGWLDVPIRNSLYYGGLMSVFLMIGWRGERRRLIWPYWVLSLASGFSGLVIFTQYLSFTPVGAAWVEGVSGRYFLPVMALFFLAVPSVGRWREESRARLVGVGLMSVAFLYIQGAGLKALWFRYWAP